LFVVEAVALTAGFFTLVFLVAAVFAFAGALVPVTAFFTVPRLDAEVTFLTGVGFLPAIVFFAGTAFALVEVADFVAEDLVAV